MPEVYVARKRLKVGDHFVLPGEEVPEAAAWRNLHSYIASGAVRLVQTDLVQAYAMTQEIPTDTPFNWKERPRNRRGKGALKPWVDYGQSGDLPDGGDGGGGGTPPALALTLPSAVPVMNAVMTSFATELANTGGEVLDCSGQWTLTLPADCTVTAADITVNMVDFNGPGEDMLIDFTQVDATTILGSYGPFPCAAGMSGETTDQVVVDSDWSGDIVVAVEIHDGNDAILAAASFTLKINLQ